MKPELAEIINNLSDIAADIKASSDDIFDADALSAELYAIADKLIELELEA